MPDDADELPFPDVEGEVPHDLGEPMGRGVALAELIDLDEGRHRQSPCATTERRQERRNSTMPCRAF